MLTRVAHLASRSVRYLQAGPDEGEAVLFLHAFPLSADQWLPQLLSAPPRKRYIAPDLRGFRGMGQAGEDFGPEAQSMDDYAADVAELLAHLDVGAATVVGLSMGGYVAFALARRAPGRLARLVLANTRATADSDDARAGRDRAIALVERNGPIGLGLEMVPKLLGESTRRDQPDLGDAVQRLIEANTPDAIVAALRAMKTRPDSTDLLAAMPCPVTVVAGAEDAIVPLGETRALHDAIPGAELVVLARAGHLSNLEDPRGFNAAIESAG